MSNENAAVSSVEAAAQTLNIVALSDIFAEFPTLHSGKVAKLLTTAETPMFPLLRDSEGSKLEVLSTKRNKPHTVNNLVFLDADHVREIITDNRVNLAPDSTAIKPNRNPTLDEVRSMTPEQLQVLQRQMQARVTPTQSTQPQASV